MIRRIWLVPLVIALWELATRLANDIDFTPPSVIAKRSYDLWFSGPYLFTDRFLAHYPVSLGRMLVGWLIACVAGVAIGVALGRSATLSGFVDPLLQFGRAIPPPMLVPFFIVLFKIGAPMQVATIVFGVIWPTLLNSIEGARYVEPLHMETARAFGVSRGQRLWRIILPAAAPKIFAGLRLSLSLALILMVISELVLSENGIGFLLQDFQRTFEVPSVWSSVMLLGILGLALNASFLLVERRILRWHRRARA